MESGSYPRPRFVRALATVSVVAMAVAAPGVASADDDNAQFHSRFINDVGTSMQSADCSEKHFSFDSQTLRSGGECYVLKTKERTSEVGAVSYTIRAWSLRGPEENLYAVFTLRLNTSARMSLVDSSPNDLMKVFAGRERASWNEWSDTSTLKIGFLKRAQQQFASGPGGEKCTVVSGRRSQSIVYLVTSCGETAVTADALEQVVRGTF